MHPNTENTGLRNRTHPAASAIPVGTFFQYAA